MTDLYISNTEESPEASELALCYYANPSNQLQIVRIANIANWYFERVVFPGQRLLFEAPPVAQLEIHSSNSITTVWSDTISCDRLRVSEQPVSVESCTSASSRQESQEITTTVIVDALERQYRL
ncbi:MAG: DUF1830 domain-containing protein [Actinomycetota bacterium]